MTSASTTRRVCDHPDCSTLLRTSNQDAYCSLHMDYVPVRPARARAGTKAEGAMGAMPATARQIAVRFGWDYKATRAIVSYCVVEGRAVAVRRVCDGCGSLHTFYERSAP